MNVLLLGSGGREHAIAWKLAQSKQLAKLYIAPGNAGTASCGENVNLNPEDFDAVKQFVLNQQVEMVVVGPEAPLVAGIHDYFLADEQLKSVAVIGPQKHGAMLEGSKDFSKEFMARHDIPTAKYKTFDKDSIEEAMQFLEQLQAPYVLKADGLAAGKGVLILEDLEEAKRELKAMITDLKFGAASAKVVVEEFLKGIELSVFVLTDGTDYVVLPEAKDYKRIGEGDTGLNTGGMGSISPVPFADADFMTKVEDRVIKPTIAGLQKDNIPYQGFVFIGLMNCGGDPYVIEYNCRMGDPETESVMPRIKNDLLELFKATAKGELSQHEMESDPRFSVAVMMVSGGYPGSYEKNKAIAGLDQLQNEIVFHAGTKFDADQVVTSGGRVIAAHAYGNTLEEARQAAYENTACISFDKMYYRKDLGRDLQ